MFIAVGGCRVKWELICAIFRSWRGLRYAYRAMASKEDPEFVLIKWTTGGPFSCCHTGVRNTELGSGQVGFGMPEII